MSSKQEYSEYLKRRFPPKEDFVKRIEKLIGKEETKTFFEICYTKTPDFIRCNTLMIEPTELKKRLESYGWKIKQPFKELPEVMIVEENKPGEIGNSRDQL